MLRVRRKYGMVWSRCTVDLIPNRLRNYHFAEQLRKQADLSDASQAYQG